jgi:CDP-diacylglycerol---serine O-phosphatidyltransferase
MLRHLPNALTIGNLLSGMLGIFLCLAGGDIYAAAWCVVLGAAFDVVDGAAARALGVTSPIGKDLDSLADAVTFGVLPSFLLINALRQQGYLFEVWTVLPACLAVGAVLRLARFNQSQSTEPHFVGLPTPAAALAVLGPAIQADTSFEADGHWGQHPIFIIASAAFVAALMVSRIKLLSLKMPLRATWPYWLVVGLVATGTAPILRGGCTLAAIAAYVLASQLYWTRNPVAKT